MATFLSAEHMTLSEALQLQGYTGQASFIKGLEKSSKIMQMLPWFPTSEGTDVHKGVKAASLPKGSFGAINKAVATGQAATVGYEERVKVYELKSEVDTRILEGRSAEEAKRIRAGRDKLYSTGYLQGLANEIVACDGTDPDSVKGLLARRTKVDDKIVFKGSGSANVGSILFIRPGEDGVNLRYPTNAGANMSIQDMGIIQALAYGANGTVTGTYPAYQTIWRTYYAIDNPDDMALIRLCNLPTKTAIQKSDIELMIDIVNSLPNEGQGYVAFMPKEIKAQLWKYLNDKTNIAFTKKEVEGMGAPEHIFNVPCFSDDYMTANEVVFA